MTAAYCMHCSADLTEERERVDVDNDEDRNDTSSPSPTSRASDPTKDTAASDGPLLDPDGLLDNSLTVVVGIIGGFIIGFIGWFAATSIFSIIIEILSTNLELLRLVVSVVLGLGSGIVVWLGATIYLVRLRTVQETISKAAYGIAIAIMSGPLIVFTPMYETTTVLFDFIEMGVSCGIVAAIIAGIGFFAGQSVPESDPE